MEIRTVAALARFIRERLAEVSTARQLAMVIVGAAAPFATTSYSRARLIRQMHAGGLLSDEHVVHTQRLLELTHDAPLR